MKIHLKQKHYKFYLPRKFYADWIKPLFPKPRYEIYGINKDDLILSKTPEKC